MSATESELRRPPLGIPPGAALVEPHALGQRCGDACDAPQVARFGMREQSEVGLGLVERTGQRDYIGVSTREEQRHHPDRQPGGHRLHHRGHAVQLQARRRLAEGLADARKFGVATRAVALATMPVLLGATWAHAGNGWLFTNANGGWEYPLFLALAALVQALLGDGAFALRLQRGAAAARAGGAA